MTIRVSVATPRFWWRAAPKDLQKWVPTDPDVAEGYRRHADRDDQRWASIAVVVARVGDALASGAWERDPGTEECGLVTLDGDPNGLTQVERRIIASWFSASNAVRIDPWFEPLADGRHRLWSTLRHFGAALVPVCSNELSYANPLDAVALGSGWSEYFATCADRLDALRWFDQSDPLNAAFRAALAMAAVGQYPSTSDPPPPTPLLSPSHGRGAVRLTVCGVRPDVKGDGRG